MVSLKLQGVSCRYRSLQAVKGIHLSLDSPGIYTLLGPNGCGKSTLLRTICGLQPFTGSCLLNQTPITDFSVKQLAKKIAYLGQNSKVNLHLPAIEIAAMGFYPTLRPFEKLNKHHYQQAGDLLAQLSAEPLAQRDFSTLSGGQQQLILFARTLVRMPELIVLDEPDSALDFENQHLMFTFLSQYAKNHHCLVLLCTHSPSFALHYSDVLLPMKEGRLLEPINLHHCSKEQLEQGLSAIYGSIEILSHRQKYILVRRDFS